ncbi:MAG: pentapeptide repeat-containing protein [Nitrosotalea sp.]
MQTTRITLTVSTLLFSALILSVTMPQNDANAQVMPTTIPAWFHYKAILWANGQISDQDFLNAIQTLISGQNVTSSTSSNGNMQGMSGMSTTTGTSTADSLLTAIGQTVYCNDVEGMQYNAQAMMSAISNCNNIQAMSGMAGVGVMGSMSGMASSGVNLMRGIPTSVSSCQNAQQQTGQSSPCFTRPSVFDEIANDMIGMSQLFTFSAYSQGMMNTMAGGPQPSMLATPSALQALSDVLSSGSLNTADYIKYFGSPARSTNDINRDVSNQVGNCRSSSFPRVNWEFCDHSGINLDHGDLTHANLIGSDLSGANLYKADVVQANLDFANLTNAQMDNIDLEGSNMSGTQLSGASMPFADFTYVTLNGANMTGTDLHQSQMRWATMERVSFQNANLNGALFMNSDLEGADFRGASLQGTGFAGADLTGANFNGDDLRSVDLGSATLTGASLHCINNPLCN